MLAEQDRAIRPDDRQWQKVMVITSQSRQEACPHE